VLKLKTFSYDGKNIWQKPSVISKKRIFAGVNESKGVASNNLK
jgi:hypothetical protein